MNDPVMLVIIGMLTTLLLEMLVWWGYTMGREKGNRK